MSNCDSKFQKVDECIGKVMDKYAEFLLAQMDKPDADICLINDGIRLLERHVSDVRRFAIHTDQMGH